MRISAVQPVGVRRHRALPDTVPGVVVPVVVEEGAVVLDAGSIDGEVEAGALVVVGIEEDVEPVGADPVVAPGELGPDRVGRRIEHLGGDVDGVVVEDDPHLGVVSVAGSPSFGTRCVKPDIGVARAQMLSSSTPSTRTGSTTRSGMHVSARQRNGHRIGHGVGRRGRRGESQPGAAVLRTALKAVPGVRLADVCGLDGGRREMVACETSSVQRSAAPSPALPRSTPAPADHRTGRARKWHSAGSSRPCRCGQRRGAPAPPRRAGAATGQRPPPRGHPGSPPHRQPPRPGRPSPPWRRPGPPRRRADLRTAVFDVRVLRELDEVGPDL